MANGNDTLKKSIDKSADSTDKTTEVKRAGWSNPVEFVLACLGYAVGLGNVWRFPYLCYRNGGGAFLIPYFIMLVAIGLPIFYLELYIGQYSSLGPLKAFSYLSPAFSGLGYCTLVIISLISIYYMIIVAWTLYYTLISLNPDLGWGSCDHEYNSIECYSGQYDAECRQNNNDGILDMTYYLKKCMTIKEICQDVLHMEPINGTFCMNSSGDAIPWSTHVNRTLASEEFYNEQVLGRGEATWSRWGSLQWHLVGCLLFSWIIAFFCVIKGVQSAGKVVYFTALFPYVMLTALLVRGVTLPGAVDGVMFYIKPDWERLTSVEVWGDAASQIFYSFGVGCGSLVTLASYNHFTNNCHFDAIIVSLTNFFTSIFAGFAIFSVLGFQAKQMGVEVSEVSQDGPGLAFVAYPEAILQMPLPQLWAILFFFMLFILGLGSQFAGIEAINTAIIDQWPSLRAHQWKVTLATCTSCFILGIPMCFSGGVYLFTLLDWNTASWAILVVGFAECVAVSWCLGAWNAMKNLTSMGMKLWKVQQWYWVSTWALICPAVCTAILLFTLANLSTPSYEGYIFPPAAAALGWLIGASTIIFLPIGFIWAYFKQGVKGMALFRPTGNWKPAVSLPIIKKNSKIYSYENEGYM